MKSLSIFIAIAIVEVIAVGAVLLCRLYVRSVLRRRRSGKSNAGRWLMLGQRVETEEDIIAVLERMLSRQRLFIAVYAAMAVLFVLLWACLGNRPTVGDAFHWLDPPSRPQKDTEALPE